MGAGHFTPELFRFLRQLRRNNTREWFERNKPRYLEQVREPLLRFIADFALGLRRISPHLVADPRPVGGSMFRIYRDTRFSRNKDPYKTHAAAQFRHRMAKDVHAPGFYLHLGSDGVFMGGGIWRPDGDAVESIRRAIVDRPGEWKRIARGKPFREGTLKLQGDSLKRPPRGFDPDHPLVEDLKRKDFITICELGEGAACAPDFFQRFTRSCRSAAPFLRFLAGALELEF